MPLYIEIELNKETTRIININISYQMLSSVSKTYYQFLKEIKKQKYNLQEEEVDKVKQHLDRKRLKTLIEQS